jgi:hypothetical protein
VQGRDFAAHLPGWSSVQPSPSQIPDAHSVAARQAAPSALLDCAGVAEPSPGWFGGGDGWSGGESSTRPGSLVVGGISLGPGAGGGLDELEQAAITSASSKIGFAMPTAYTPPDE